MKEQEQHLLDYFRKLSQQDAHALLRFAAFLAGDKDAMPANVQNAASPPVAGIPKPQYTERPENERVVDAIKRLSNTYPMLDKKKLLDKASGLVAQHVMFGKPAREIIDQIEKLFAEAYDAFVRDAERG